MSFNISVIIPCYNQAHFLSDCLGSLVNQDFTNWEAIVIDDASTIGDVEKEVSIFKDSRIKFFKNEKNLNKSNTLNRGIRLAKYEYVFLLDSDDYLEKSCLLEISRVIEKDETIDIVYTNYKCFGLNNEIRKNKVSDLKSMLLASWIPNGSLVKKKIYERVGGYDPKVDARIDWDFFIRAIEKNSKCFHINKNLYYYRIGHLSLTAKGRMKNYEYRLYFYQKYKRLYDKYNLKNEFIYNGFLTSAKYYKTKGNLLKAYTLFLQSFKYFFSLKTFFIFVLYLLIPQKLINIRRRSIHRLA